MVSRGLAASRHAPWHQHTTGPTTAPRRHLVSQPPPLTVTPTPPGNSSRSATSSAATYELGRFIKIVRRLRWKMPFMEHGYSLATDPNNADRLEAELMFKMDFFEYYMLLERALVHLLGVFGITVSRGSVGAGSSFASRPSANKGLSSSVWRDGRPDNGGGGGAYASGNNNSNSIGGPPPAGAGGSPWGHSYHANVLEALDSPMNPLHEVFGKGETRYQLQRAKDLRNRWKTAADDNNQQGRDRTSPAPLETYHLPPMFAAIIQGFEDAFSIAESFVCMDGMDDDDNTMDLGTNNTEGSSTIDWMTRDEEQWEFMVDAMDWEAV
ncbi:hypothetical protein B0H63DRAFT_307070 [Podospora didyma]|uniref:Fungal specific transcription factor n=1 Tax=Podospora didyma TaxID=330526 RepID=A0AAE0K4T9_9PEZI|nr:hypothetical protein B0H63DRAFT_307070 [Podospora didyma]